MKFTPTPLPGALLIEPQVFQDDRGFFLESYQKKHFSEAGIPFDFVQDNHSKSCQGVLRGLHYQIKQAQGKLTRVVVGEIYDVAVDIRRNSPTFGKWFGTYLSAENKQMLWVPPGFAHGFYVTSPQAELLYKATDYYAPRWDRTIVWNDPEINIEWPLKGELPILSPKDEAGGLFSTAEVYEDLQAGMNIVLFGKSGQLGWELERSLPILGNLVALDRGQLDLRDLNAVQQTLSELKPNLIINASAYTDVDRAEKEPEQAMNVNALAPGVMAEESRKLGAVLIHYSTDYVFDGRANTPYTEDHQTNPLNVYGKSKLMGEESIKQAGAAYLILRTSWVYSLRGNSFVNKVLGWARKNSTLRVVDDQVSGPTWARMLAEITSLLLTQNQRSLYEKIHEQCGIYHLAGSGYTSRYEWAKEILANDPHRSEQTAQAIEPGRSEEFPTPAARPLFSALDCTRFEKTFGLQLPPWNSTLKLAMAG